MNFWDSSALVPLVVEEPTSPACRALLPATEPLAVWALAAIEVTSSLRRKEREGGLDAAGTQRALDRLDALAATWIEVEALAAVKARAARLLAVHPLRAADAVQLAAALVLVGDEPKGSMFVTRDVRLRDAARREGFGVADL